MIFMLKNETRKFFVIDKLEKDAFFAVVFTLNKFKSLESIKSLKDSLSSSDDPETLIDRDLHPKMVTMNYLAVMAMMFYLVATMMTH